MTCYNEKNRHIDYVVPMVFPEDALWQKDFEKYALPYMGGPVLFGSWRTGRKLTQYAKRHLPWVRNIYVILRNMSRFLWYGKKRKDFEKSPGKYTDTYIRWRSWGTERQLIQLIKKNLPWVRNIYVILARESQLQPWMDDEKVKVVYHKDFIPNKYLPAFNSNTIEMFLHKIPGLSEYFIYGNDDMFPLSPMEDTDFFIDGKPCQHMIEREFPLNPSMFQQSCLNGQSFVADLFGKGKPHKWLINGHSIAPIRKCTCENLWKVGETKIEASITMIRSEKNFLQYIYSWWQHYSGEYVDKSFPNHYIGSHDVTPEDLTALIIGTKGVLCINDSGGTDDFRSLAKAAREALDSLL